MSEDYIIHCKWRRCDSGYQLTNGLWWIAYIGSSKNGPKPYFRKISGGESGYHDSFEDAEITVLREINRLGNHYIENDLGEFIESTKLERDIHMPTLQEKLTRHFNISKGSDRFVNMSLLHQNLCGFIGVSTNDDTITIYHDGGIRVDKTEYPADYSLSTFLREMEDSYQTLYSELKHVSDVLFGLQEKMGKISKRVDGNGHSSFYSDMLKKIFEGYTDTLKGMSSSVNAIANYTPSYGVTEGE